MPSTSSIRKRTANTTATARGSVVDHERDPCETTNAQVEARGRQAGREDEGGEARTAQCDSPAAGMPDRQDRLDFEGHEA